MMKTEDQPPRVGTWTNNVELLRHEEYLPVIENCQVSSILHNLNPVPQEIIHQNMDLIILQNNTKLSIENSFNLQDTSYVILKEDGSVMNNVKINVPDVEKIIESNQNKNFDNVLYFVCNLCPFLCTKETKIAQHLDSAHKNKSAVKLSEFKCPACRNIFYHRMSLRSHLLHDHGVGNSDLNLIIQTIIGYSNKTNGNDKKADILKKDPDVITLKKTIIGKNGTTNDINNLSNSMPETQDIILEDETKGMVSPLTVEEQKKCETVFNTLTKSNRISVYADSNTVNKCIIPNCKVQLKDADKMSYHINSHIDCGFKCNECNENFSLWKPLTSHLWRLHGIDMDLYSCDKCEYKSFSLAKLNNIHKLIHGEVKSYTCDVCKKCFKNSKQLRNHKMIHKDQIDQTIYKCEICSKTFTNKRRHKIHMDGVHKQIRPYLCNFCGYKGSSRSSLKMHIRQHTGEKPFSCNSCPYVTSDHNSLRRHKLRHTGQKPYKCKYCSYGCIQSSTYKTHLKTKHPGMEKDLMFTCRECQFRSVNKDIFTSHLITVHKMKLQLKS